MPTAIYLMSWKALSGRIEGLVKAAQLCRPDDSFRTLNELGDQASRTIADLEDFKSSFSRTLPQSALDAINNCVRTEGTSPASLLRAAMAEGPGFRSERIWSALIRLASFETEMTFILSDTQTPIRARSELAFLHLQRLIVVDAATRKQWQDAFKCGEVACEKLGAVHLLLHGIWAFKVSAEGERTDLVFPEQRVSGEGDERYADGLVLTEWKIASSDDSAQERFAAARAQAQRYAQGVLAGSELARFRYVIVVTPRHVTRPDDISEGPVIYRHINIAVVPETPSQARSLRRGKMPLPAPQVRGERTA